MKYISIGRYLYFEFDLDYCEFSLTNTVVLMFVFAVIATIISGITSFITNRLWGVVSKHYKKKVQKVITGIALVVVNIVFYIIISQLLIPEDNLSAIFFAVLCILAITSYVFINYFDNGLIKNNYFKLVSGIAVVIILIAAVSLMRTEYINAKDQTTFPLIIEEKGADRYYYVVINKGKEMYSAYLCEVVEDTQTLNIIINEHKYFPINNTKTYSVAFASVERYIRNDLSVSDFLEMDYEHID